MDAATLRAAALALRRGDVDGAERALSGLRPGVGGRGWTLRARVAEARGEDPRWAFEEALGCSDASGDTALAFGQFEARVGRIDAGVDVLLRGLELEPAHPGCRRAIEALLRERPEPRPGLTAAIVAMLDDRALDPLPIAAELARHATAARSADDLLVASDGADRALLLGLLRTTTVPDAAVEAAVCAFARRFVADPEPALLEAARACGDQCAAADWVFELPSAVDAEPGTELERAAARLCAPRRAPSTSVGDPVCAQYEAWPYPRWLTLPAPDPRFLSERLASVVGREHVAHLERPVRALVAGCGTGRHALTLAGTTICSEVLGVDVSAASLAWAERMQEELGDRGVRFERRAIEDLGGSAQTFDLIECSGVLHHLADPRAGWRILVDRLAPGGVMQIGLYSRRGRADVFTARDRVRHLRPDLAGLREARRLLRALPPTDPARTVVDSPDFYSGAGLVDLLFHAREAAYALPEIAELLDALGLRFLGFDGLDDATRRAYDAFNPDRADLAAWDAFEADHPSTFGWMFQFWVARSA